MRTLLYFILICLSVCKAFSQERLELTLEEALALGRDQSIASKENENIMFKAWWSYRNYRAGLLPNITLGGTLPSLNRSLNTYQKEDGTYTFIPNNYISEMLNLTVSQAIPFTGGMLYIESGLERMDQLGADRYGNFLSVPFSLTLSQPLLAYNPYKWQKKTEPLRYETSKSEYIARIENVNINTVNYYFDLIISMTDLESARQNLKNSQDLYAVAQAREKIGTISDSDLMQLRVGLLNAEASVLNAKKAYLEKMNILRNYLGIQEGIEIWPEVPQEKTVVDVYADDIRKKARENNPLFDNFRLRLLEAEANMTKAKRERMPDISVNLSIGTTGSHPTFAGAYGNLGNRQIAQIGLSIPILDWGKRKGNYEQAKSDYNLEQERIRREEDEFNEQVRALTEDFISQQELVEIYREADAVAQERYGIALDRFTVGDISVTDLNYAEQEKDAARQNYIYQIYLSWLYYYNLRYITLYDFETGTSLDSEIFTE